MYPDALSRSILRLCDDLKLSYEAASERCRLSARYFGSVARGQTAASIRTLEKLCMGFGKSPNELLLPVSPAIQRFRDPLPVSGLRILYLSDGPHAFPVCPECDSTLDREFQCFCDRCGQLLDWSLYAT